MKVLAFLLFIVVGNVLAKNLEPAVGEVGQEFKFTVRYWHSGNEPPALGYPILYLYKDTEGKELLGTFTPNYSDNNEPKSTTTYTMLVVLKSVGTYSYRFEAYDRLGNKATGPATLLQVGPYVFARTVFSEPPIELPKETKLYSINPNIITGAQNIKLSFDLAVKAKVILKIYNIVGQLVNTIDVGELNPGVYRDISVWDLSNSKGEKVSSGVYFLVFQAGNYKVSRNIVVIK